MSSQSVIIVGSAGGYYSGRRSGVIRIVAGLLILLSSLSPLLAETAWTLEKLMAGFATTEKRHYRYSETKTSVFLSKPLQFAGELKFVKPDTMEKIVTSPSRKVYRITGNELVVEKPGEKNKTVLLDNFPELQALTESLRATFSGKLSVLKEYFETRLSGTAIQWTLTLTPLDESLSEKVQSVVVHGKQKQIHKITIIRSSRSRSELVLESL